jgi:hypothetical protein
MCENHRTRNAATMAIIVAVIAPNVSPPAKSQPPMSSANITFILVPDREYQILMKRSLQ